MSISQELQTRADKLTIGPDKRCDFRSPLINTITDLYRGFDFKNEFFFIAVIKMLKNCLQGALNSFGNPHRGPAARVVLLQ